MASIKTKIEGLAAVGRRLEQLPIKSQRDIWRGGMRKVGSMIAKQAKRNAPVDTGLGRAAITYKVQRLKGDPLGMEAKVGIKVKARTRLKKQMLTFARGKKRIKIQKVERKRNWTPFWMRLQEMGHFQKYGKGRKQKRWISERPWLRPALSRTQQQGVEILRDETTKKMPIVIAKLRSQP